MAVLETSSNMQHTNYSQAEIISFNSKMIGTEVQVVCKEGSTWRGKVEKVIDEEYFEISKFENPLQTEIVSMYDIRSLSYETI